MAIHTDAEPLPRIPGDRPANAIELRDLKPLPAHIETPPVDFFDVLAGRRSRVGGSVPTGLLGSLLWHATQLRERGFDGRFGQWESRPTPSAGGIHSIRLLAIPLDADDVAGVYDDATHAIGRLNKDAAAAIALNRASVTELTAAVAGTTLQLFADPTRLAACYDNHSSLLWRDAGAVTATLCMTAEALGLNAVPLGRHGDEVAHAFGLPAYVVGLGAVHIGARSSANDTVTDPTLEPTRR